MKLLALALLLSLSPVSTKDYRTFRALHMYNRHFSFDCEEFMNRVLKNLHLPCKVVNTVILGDKADITNTDDVVNVCAGGGVSVGHGLIQSRKTFRTATCLQQGSGGFPPDCIYRRHNTQSKITVTCQYYQPVHLEKVSLSELEENESHFEDRHEL